MIFNFSEVSEMVINNYGNIVTDIVELEINSFRILLIDESYLHVWHSLKLEDKYSYHWERKGIDNTVYRHDNAPHLKWKKILTFPKHFHNRTEENVEESYISDVPIEAIFEFLDFIQKKTGKVN
jgi:hypothetical protein